MATISNNEIKIKYTLDTTDLANATALFDKLSAEDRQLLNDLKKLQAQLNATGQAGQAAGNAISQGTSNATQQVDKMGLSIKRVGGLIAGYFSVQAIVSFGKAVLDTTIKFEALSKAIEFTSGSLVGGAANMRFLAKTAEEFGIPLDAVIEGFKSLSAAAGRNRIPMDQQRQMFTDLSAAMSALSLTAQDAQLIFFGFGQMLSKPKVSAQELYHQIGERLPIALEAAQIAAAKVTGVTQVTAGELTKLVETGKLFSAEFAPAFTEALGKMAASGAHIDTLGKDVERLSNAWINFKLAIGELTSGYFAGVLDKITNFTKRTVEEVQALNYYLENGLKMMLPGFDVPSFEKFKENQQQVLDVFDGIIDGAKYRYEELNNINAEYQNTFNDTSEAGNLKRKEIEERYNKERVERETEIQNDIKKRQNDILNFRKNIVELQKKIDDEYLRTGYTEDLEKRINSNKQYIKQAESAVNALKTIFKTLPQLPTLIPDPDAEKKKQKELEDLYRKLIAQQEALKKAEDDRIKSRTREGYTRDIELLKNNVKFNEEMLLIDERADFIKLELAKNNAVKRRGENKRDNQEQLNIRAKALDQALKLEEEYLKKSQDKINEATYKRRSARQTELTNELNEIKKNGTEQTDALIIELNKAISIQELSDSKRVQLIKNYDAQITKIKTDNLNQQLFVLNQYYEQEAILDQEAAFDRELIYSRASTRRLAADAKNEYQRQDILDQGTLADINTEKNRLMAEEQRLQKSLVLSTTYKDREIAMIKAKLADLASQEYELQVNAETRKREKMLEIVQASADAMAQIFNDLGNIYIANLDRQQEALNQKYDADVRLADGNKQKLAQLAQEKARAEYEIELKQFKARQIMAVAEVIFKTAPEIAKWISTGVLAPVAAIGLAAQAFAIGAILSQPPPVPPYKDGTKGIPHPGGPAIVGEAGVEKVVTTTGQVYYTPPTATLLDLPKGSQVIPNHALSRKELFWANSLSEGRRVAPNNGIENKLDKIGGILQALPIHQINMNERGFEKFVRTERRTTKILNNRFPLR